MARRGRRNPHGRAGACSSSHAGRLRRRGRLHLQVHAQPSVQWGTPGRNRVYADHEGIALSVRLERRGFRSPWSPSSFCLDAFEPHDNQWGSYRDIEVCDPVSPGAPAPAARCHRTVVRRPGASAGTLRVDSSAPFDAVDLTRAIEVRAAGGAACAVIDVRMVRPDQVRVACDERTAFLGVGDARGDDAARAVALTILALAEPGIQIPGGRSGAARAGPAAGRQARVPAARRCRGTSVSPVADCSARGPPTGACRWDGLRSSAARKGGASGSRSMGCTGRARKRYPRCACSGPTCG